MEHTGPLEPFFEWLSREQSLEITLSDRLRMGRLFQAEGEWTLERLEDGLGALLTHDPDQWTAFRRHFREFFASEAAQGVRPRPLDRQALIAALERLNEEPPPVPALAVTLDDAPARTEIVSPEVKPTAAPRVLFRLREIPWPASLSAPEGDRPVRAARLRVVWAKDDPDKPRQFFWAQVGEEPAPLLDDRLLDHLADAMGYFQSQRPSRLLDVDRTLRASLEQSYPVLQFVPGREVCHLVVLEDTTADARVWNTVPRELAAGLADRGVPVTYGLFDGSPARFRSADGSTVCELEDWEDVRQGLLLLLFSEGKRLVRRAAARVLDDLALWPRVAWMDFREPQFWDSCAALPAARGLLTFPATPQGLLDMSRALLTEQGPRSGSRGARPEPGTPRLAGLPLEQLVEQVLGDALPWAQACAMLPAVPHRLGDAIRRQFHPDVPGTSWGRLQALPRTRRDAEGWHLADDVREVLRRSFFAQRSGAQSQQVLEFVRQQIQTTGRLLPPDSLARFACDGALLRLSIQAGETLDGEQLARLTQSDLPIADAVTGDLRQEATLLRALGRLTPDQSRVLEDLKIIPPRPSPYPPDLVRIPAGPFRMGDPTEEGYEDERPQHEVYVSEFYIGKHAVTWELWQQVYQWAVKRGYEFDNRGAGRGPDHPVTDINWYDAVKWCNARSEKEGREPAYYADPHQEEPYRRGQLDLTVEHVDWTANGYRLPTEAEWEKAARGGLDGHHYPWPSQGDRYERFISPDKANYNASKKDGTTPVGTYPPNGYGLFDMAGNVYDWVWDSWDDGWYRKRGATESDVRGPDSGVLRVYRGGSWGDSARLLRCACRDWWHPSFAYDGLGFRLAGGQAESKAAKLDEGGERGSRDETPGEPPESSGADQACLTIELVPSGPRGRNADALPQNAAEFHPTPARQNQGWPDGHTQLVSVEDQLATAQEIRELLVANQTAEVVGEESLISLGRTIRKLLCPDNSSQAPGGESDLQVARRLQDLLLPTKAPQMSGFDIAGAVYRSTGARADSFDYWPMPDGSLAFTIADVAGRGLDAALLMATMWARLRLYSQAGIEVHDVLTRVNKELAGQYHGDRFVTAILGRLDARSRTLVYSNAGHVPVYVLDAAGQPKAEFEPAGLPINLVTDEPYPLGGPMQLESGDLVLLITDGATDVSSPEGVEFGMSRVLEVVRSHLDKSAAAIIERLHDAVREFGRRKALPDDLAAIVVKVLSIPKEEVQLSCGDSHRRVAVGEPTLLSPGPCRVTATRRFCWPATTAHELAAGKAYQLRILMQRQPPPGMVEIPAGPFRMGDPTTEGDDDERPQHEVLVSAFFMAQHQVTWALWRDIYDWAVRHGYQFKNRGGGYGDDHPVHSVNWYDVVKWCNAYSEREGRDPAYFEDRLGGKVYRQGDVDLPAAAVDWNGEGFRLPTEAEWEKSARGGLVGHHYPWESAGAGYGRFIAPDKANYDASKKGSTTPVGSYRPNGYQLYDVAGNVREWCWDWFDTGWYRSTGAEAPNTRGPDGGVRRVVRGGSWGDSARDLRCAYRYGWRPSSACDFQGFRLAGGQAEQSPRSSTKAESGGRGTRPPANRRSRAER